MLRRIFGPSRQLAAGNENEPESHDSQASHERPKAAAVRALATGAALAVSIDNSPAVLLSVYDYAHRFRDRPRRAS